LVTVYYEDHIVPKEIPPISRLSLCKHVRKKPGTSLDKILIFENEPQKEDNLISDRVRGQRT